VQLSQEAVYRAVDAALYEAKERKKSSGSKSSIVRVIAETPA